jgi:multicomponent Na+:H+ antiporter subunit F
MKEDVVGVPDVIISAALAVLAVALLLSVVRMVRGPNLMDRVVALELMAGLVVGVIAVFAIGTDDPALLDVAITLALVAFLTAVAFARYAERALRR